jgi:DNA-binding transcriptional LysR family regulator
VGTRRGSGKRDLPFRQVAQFWNWLPAFRAVAEVGGINEAARLLRVSPSALSRSVGLLEAALGEALFFREGRLAPTAAGERLLAATRDAMRLLHEATRTDASPSGPINLAATSRLGFYRLLPILRVIRQRWPGVETRTSTVRDADVEPLLLRGQVDLVVAIGVVAPKRLASARLPPAACHVYCGKGHPLFLEKRPTEARVQAHAFAAPVSAAASAVAMDAWPTDVRRTVGLACDSLEPAIDACVQGELLMCLPDEIVHALGLKSRLRALPNPPLAATALQCVHRPPVGSTRTLVAELVGLLSESSEPRV